MTYKMTANKEVVKEESINSYKSYLVANEKRKEEERDFDVDIKSAQEKVDSFEQELLEFLEPFIGWDAAEEEAEELFIKYEDEIKRYAVEGNHDAE
jgi:hypothetical protein